MKLGQRSLLNAVSSTAAFVWPLLLLAAAMPFILHRLGLERFGAWALINAVLALAATFSLGLGDGTMKLVAESHARRDLAQTNRVLGLGLLIYALLGLGLGIVLALATPLLVDRIFAVGAAYRAEVRAAFWLATATLAVTLTATPLARVATAVQRYEWAAGTDIVLRSLTVLAQVLLLWRGYGLAALALAGLILAVLRAGIQFAVARRLIPGLRPRLAGGRQIVRRLVRFSAYGACIYIGGQATQQLDRLLIGVLAGPAILPFYVVPQALGSRLHLLLAHAGHFLFPLASALAAAGDMARLARSFHLATRVLSLGAMTVALPPMLVAYPLLQLWLGAELAEGAAPVLRWLVLSYALLSLNLSAYYLLQGIERPQINAAFALLNLLGVVAICVLALPRWHLTGLAVGLALFHAVSSASQLVLVQRRILGRPVGEMGRVLAPAGLVLATTLLAVATVGPQVGALHPLVALLIAAVLALAVMGLGLGADRLLWGSESMIGLLRHIVPQRRRPGGAAPDLPAPRSAAATVLGSGRTP